MLTLGARFALSTIPAIIDTIIGLYELMIILRVAMGWLVKFNVISEGKISWFLFKVTEPVLSPVRETLFRIFGYSGWDFSPMVAIALCELIQWLIKLIF